MSTDSHWKWALLLMMAMLSACRQGGRNCQQDEQPAELPAADVEFYYGGDPFHPTDTGMRRYTDEYDLRQQIEHDGAEVKMIEDNTNKPIN